jgi:hypothetical protein
MIKQTIRDFTARQLARWMRHFALDPRYFELWQAHGYHVKQVHFYSPLPDTRELEGEDFSRISELPGLDLNEDDQLQLLAEFRTGFHNEYSAFPRTPPSGPPRFYFGNTSLEAGDAEALYCMIRKFHPQCVVEIGSGYSTLLAGQALAKNASEGFEGKLTAIEPYPRHFLRESLPFPVELIERTVQSVPLERFTSLRENDILFIDSSHVCKIGSDVHYEFLEILPRLAPGVIVHVHDIFLPMEYPRTWVKEWHRFWNEQYLLQAFLCGNRNFEVLFAGAWMTLRHPQLLADSFPSFLPGRNQLGSFWLRRRG